MRRVSVAAAAIAAAVFLSSRPASAQVGACAVPQGPALPDLVMDQNLLSTQLFVSEEQFTSSSCTVVEGVVSRPGKQVVLRFNTSTPNVGQTDMVIGDPSQCPQLFEFSDCHQHLHFHDFAAYRLWSEAGYATWVAMRDANQPANVGINADLIAAATASGDLISGHKQGFCMVDSAQYSASAGAARYLSCSTNQGISVGWEDVYAPQLPDQFLQITGLNEGTYVLENQVNPDQILPESNYANNFAAVRIRYTPRHGKIPAKVEIVP